MPGPAVRVVPEDLLVSGASVDGHAKDLCEVHAVANSRIDSDLPFLPRLAAAALAETTARWQATTADLIGRLTDHALALRTSGMGYIETDDSCAQMVGAVAANSALATVI